MFKWLWAFILGNNSKGSFSEKSVARPQAVMNEGDMHSGTHGYSANTPYPETQYGSGYDESADWYEEEH